MKERVKRPGTKRSGAKRSAAKSGPKATRGPSSGRSTGPAFKLQPKSAQPKVKIGKPNDKYEREADAVAGQVASGQKAGQISRIPTGGLQRQAAEEDEAQTLQRVEESEEEAQTLQRVEESEEEAQTLQRVEESEEEAQTLQRAEESEEEAQTLQRVEESEEEAQTLQRAEESEEEAQTLQRAEESEEEAQTPQRMEESEDEEAQSLQRSIEEDGEPVQELQRQEDEEEAQTSPASGGSRAMTRAASKAISSKDPGRPMHPATRNTLERGMQTDLGGVRIHDDAKDRQAAKDLNARAFAHGNDIWLGPGESESDVRLMAHEATHTVQQGASVQRIQRLVQRDGDGAPSEPGVFYDSDKNTKLDTNTSELEIPEMKLPDVVNKRRNLQLPIKLEKTPREAQLAKWRKEIAPATNEQIKTKINENNAVEDEKGKKNWYLRAGASGRLIAGSLRRIQSEVKRPNWTHEGKPVAYHVDHALELQIGGADETSNYQLLDATTNTSSGAKIKGERKRVITKALQDVQEANPEEKLPSYDEVASGYKKQVKSLSGTALPINGEKIAYLFDKVASGVLIKPLHVLSKEEVDALPELQGTPNKLSVLMPNGTAVGIKWSPGKGQAGLRRKNFAGVTGFKATGISYEVGQGGTLTGQVAEGVPGITAGEISLKLEELASPYSVVASDDGLSEQLSKLLKGEGMSPIEFTSASLSGQFEAFGVLKPTPSVFQGLALDLSIVGDKASLSKTFTTDELKVPGPVELTESSVTVSLGNKGFELSGELKFKVDKVGEGSVTAGFAKPDGPFLKGSFDIDKELVDKGKVSFDYRKDTFKGTGEIGIKADKFKGVKSATGKFDIENDQWTASGTVNLAIPSTESATLTIGYSTEKGLEIGGEFEFGQGVPRLKKGKIKMALAQNESGGPFKLSGSGTADLDIPGVSASVQASYDDGVFSASGKLGYEKGIAKGEITAGVTNAAVDDSGQATGDPTDTLTPFGKGQVTLKFTPWLEAGVGLELKPDGSIIVSGEIGIPDVVEVFPEKKIEKEILSIGFDIPIVGVAVAGQRIGIFVTIGGNLTARASVGPGELRELKATVTYNPEDESATTVTGAARFVIPAEAGLRLGVNAALGAGIPIVSASAGLEIGAALGIKGEAVAAANLEWTPSTGINLDAFVSLSASPSFKFDVTGFVKVEADLLLKTIELYEKRWELAAFEYGSGMTTGVKFPVKVENNALKELSLSDVEFITPDIDASSMLKGLVGQIV